MKTLNEILKNITVNQIIGNTTIEIKNIQFDSRNVNSESIFVAINGYNVDGHKFIEKAISLGAKTIVCEVFPETINENISYILVKNSSEALGKIAANFYNNPTKKLKVVGITGTNGKTTTATLLYRIFESFGYKTGLISTVVNYIHETEISSTHTTPDQVQLQKLFSQMIDEGCEYCFMEVSSHSIHQQRISSIEFVGGVFTNITHDHLDYHKTFKEYISVKKTFFDNLQKKAFAITNFDDKNGEIMLQNCKAKKLSYALKTPADYKTKILESHFNGMLLKINEQEVWTKFIGNFNAYNLTAVYAVAIELGLDKLQTLVAISKLTSVNGRFEYFTSANGITAIVDYAHTPDALKNVLETIQEIKKGTSKIITVVGAGGDRDKTKRPEMAQISAEKSDKIILTSDNPRSEDPIEIIKEMEAGISTKLRNKVISITDRKEAIRAACMFAQNGDIVLIAGKGHETYQEIKGVKHHFDDKEIVRETLNIEN